jgi:ATP-binding cassette subfamily B protein
MAAAGKAFDFSILKRLYARSSSYRIPFLMTLMMVLILAAMSVIRPAQMREIMDDGLAKDNLDLVKEVSILFILVMLIETLIQYFQTYSANKIAQSITLDLRSELFKHSVGFKMSHFDKTPVGQWVTRHISDIDGIAEVFSVGLLDIFRDTLKLLVIISAMLWIDWKMTLVVCIPIPLLLYATRIFQQTVKKSFNDVRNEVARINVFIQEHVTGMGIVQLFGQEKREQRKFNRINAEHRDAHIRGIWAYSIFFPVVEILSAMSVSFMILYALSGTLNMNTTPGVLLQFSTFISMMYRPIRQMADNFNVLQMGMVNADRVFQVLDTQVSEVDLKEVSSPRITKGEVVYNDVSFSYIPGQPVLEHFSLDVKPGNLVAFVGATGSGKSTVVQLLNRIYEPQHGKITIDGVDIKNYSLETLRSQIGVVPQDTFLFSDTIFNNLTLYDERISLNQVVAACKAVGIHDFIGQLPGEYEFNVRERGGTLSVGQRQLLAFVRAYLQDPTILILDEATSSVDTDSERLIQRATEVIIQHRTSFVVAHRLSTIQKADVIVVLDHGKVVESGTHAELIERQGVYFNLYKIQFENNG